VLGVKRPEQAREAMETLLAHEFPEAALDRSYCLDVLRWMHSLKRVSFYDAAYHVLAMRSGGVYVTADREYAGRAGRRRDVVLLPDWKAPARRPEA
jgi:predicted nucleic acid-binding protein